MKIIDFLKSGMKQRLSCYHHETEILEYGYLEPSTEYHQCFKLRRKWFFITLPKVLLFKEEIPLWAKIQSACLGYTEWRSEAPQWMHDLSKEKSWKEGWKNISELAGT